ncbi:transcriptional regulator [Elasticomyces elasticus]|nr:transcriptional regulator [Elasticomyces elasticus]
MDSVHDALQDLEEPSNNPDVPSRGMTDPSLDLSHKASIPDCYQLITQLIAMKQIENKFYKKRYHSPRVFRHDIALLCNNCRQYNEEGSVPYNDANMIKLREETRIRPDLHDCVDPSVDGASTRPISTVGTPQPPPKSGFKLKLIRTRANGQTSRGGTERLAQCDDED